MDRLELQKLRDLPIEGVAERLGLHVVRGHRSLCPFHDDRHPSLSYHLGRNTFRCFVCGAKGGTIDLVMRLHGMDFREACRWLAREHNVLLSSPCSPSGGGRMAADGRLSGGWMAENSASEKPCAPLFDPRRYGRFFERPWLNEDARRFLYDERRIDPRVVRWCRLTSWRDRQGVSWLQVPYYDLDGRLTGIQSRNLSYRKPAPSGPEPLQVETALQNGDSSQGVEPLQAGNDWKPSAESCKPAEESLPTDKDLQAEILIPRFRFPRGSRCTIYNLPVVRRLRPGDGLYITEGCSDCWAMLSAGHKAIAIPSATLLSREDKELLTSLSASLAIEWHMYPDRDAPGERLFLQLKEILPGLTHHQLPPGYKDFAEWFAAFPGNRR